MKVLKNCFFIGCYLCGVTALWAQNVTIPYSMSFEASGADSLELVQNWVLNAGPQASLCNDRWIVGSSVRSDGRQALYVVNSDTVDTPCFGEKANLQFAYRDFKFPAGSYYLSFDWLNAGDANTAMYVGYVYYTNPSAGAVAYITANATSGVMPAVLTNTNNSGALYGQSNWQSYTFANTINVSGAANGTYRLYVAWANKGNNVLADSVFGGCIDNIQIFDSRVALATDIAVTAVSCDTLLLTWKGSADTYVVQYRQVGKNNWTTVGYDPSMGTSVLLEGMEEGSYSFRVRSISYDSQGNAMYGAYAYCKDDYLVYCDDRHCLTYFDLTAPNVVCTYGTTWYSADSLTNSKKPFENIGMIDYGADSELSRHTVCWDKDATDPRTGGLLRIVPSDMRASVRLGNWNDDAEAEGITYTMTIDSASCILMLRYAVVLQDPDHSVDEQPRFTIEICGEDGEKIDPTCGYINFAADATREGWQSYGEGYDRVTWKDWTTIGLHLEDHIGETITVRLATYDCTLGAHFGYAYFALDCASATIESASCGADTHFSAEAPAGFAYRWTTQDGTVVSTTRNLDVISSDSMEYTCRLTNLEEAACWFELKVLALPKFPISDGTWAYTPVDCKNRVTFTNRSYVQTRYNGEVRNNYNQNLTGLRWDFGDGKESEQANCTHDFPATGGTYVVTLSTWLAEETTDCVDDTTFVVIVPAIGDTTMRDTVDICEGGYHEFGGSKRTESGDYAYDGESEAGCNVHYMCHLRVHPKDEIVLPDVHLCYGDTFCLSDTCYLSPKDGEFRLNLTNQYGCDSLIIVNVHYADPIVPTLEVTQMSEYADEALVRLGGTGYTYYTINNGTNRTDDLFTTTEAGDYLFSFYNELGCVDTLSVNIRSACLRGRLFQRWNDIVAIYNKEYMQDTLEFVSYQWYEDDMPIEGATMSYYCAPDGLTIGAQYSCCVGLADGSQAMICPLIAENLVQRPQEVEVAPTVVAQGGSSRVYVPVDGQAVCYDALGAVLFAESLEAGSRMLSFAGLNRGVYLLRISQPDGIAVYRISVQ